ncbi:hypothetical protein [Streptomyces sp. NRRL F-5123]|uniref:hypothetical protein n=1 Tax=Streptomyces sp. NRRL F-5123 TaxID=1463856 RepID=UPI00069426DE|nr:hypothetical protein [Streptomyces sp. NRRL F-5123]
MLRNISGSLLALIGAVLAVWSPFRIWYGGRLGSRIRVDGLFTGAGVTPDDAALLGSLFLPMSFAALLALLGVLARSRLTVGAAGVLVLGVTVLWMVRQGQTAGSLTAGGDGMDVGVAAAVSAGALLLLAAAAFPRRRARARRGGGSLAGDTVAGDTFAGGVFAGDTFAGDAFAGDAATAAWPPPPAYAPGVGMPEVVPPVPAGPPVEPGPPVDGDTLTLPPPGLPLGPGTEPEKP